MPAAALIAGRELARLFAGLRPVRAYAALSAAIVVGIGGFTYYYFSPRARNPLIRHTIALKQLAAEVEARAGRGFPLVHVDDPMAFQFYLDTLEKPVSFEVAAERLRGPQPVFVAVNNLAKLDAARKSDDPPLFRILPPPGSVSQSPTHIVGNRPELAREQLNR
jgi:hypothetical protein